MWQSVAEVGASVPPGMSSANEAGKLGERQVVKAVLQTLPKYAQGAWAFPQERRSRHMIRQTRITVRPREPRIEMTQGRHSGQYALLWCVCPTRAIAGQGSSLTEKTGRNGRGVYSAHLIDRAAPGAPGRAQQSSSRRARSETETSILLGDDSVRFLHYARSFC